jgi:hypothetical protein
LGHGRGPWFEGCAPAKNPRDCHPKGARSSTRERK